MSFGSKGGARGKQSADANKKLAAKVDLMEAAMAKLGTKQRFSGCYNCGEEGHVIADCPKPLQDKFKKG